MKNIKQEFADNYTLNTQPENLSNQKLYDLKMSFLKEWPIERLKTMTLEEYTNLDKTSFCYWIEAITNDIGSVWGGSAYKFGIFKRKELDSDNYNEKRKSDGEYSWYGKYGEDKENVFENIRNIILNIATYSQQNRLKDISEVDLGNAYKWKIAFLYGNFNIINIFKHGALKTCAKYLGYQGTDQDYPSLNKYVLSQKGDKDFFDFSGELWAVFEKENSLSTEFEKWLKTKDNLDSGKINSYLRAIQILTDHFKIDIYTEDDIDVLEELYEDLKLHQKDENGKYNYKSKSYGKGGFYSAAVNSYIEFLNQIEEVPSNLNDESRLISILKKIGFHDSEKFYDLMENILLKLNIKSGDKRICYSLPKNKRIGLTLGQKYCAIIEQKKGRNSFRYFDTTLNEKNWLKEANSIESMSSAINTIVQTANKELNKTIKSGYENHSSVSLEKSLFDKEYKKHIFYKAFNKDINTNIMDADLNQIFFGPPGTGKTYHTINEAIKISDPVFFNENHGNRDKLKERFKLLLLNNDNEDIGQIGFTTFHQSFSYEDFIEGIKPMEPIEGDTYLKYAIQEGIFKKICRLANDSLNAVSIHSDSLISLSKEEYEKSHFYKMSLGNTQNEEDNEIYNYCIENNCITIGFGNGVDFSGKDEKELRIFGQKNNLQTFPINAMNLFCNYLKIGNYVVISNGNNYVRAIGKVVGEYEYIEESPFPNNSDWKHFRKVKWLITDKKIPVKEIYNKNLQQQTIYKLEKKEIKLDFFVKEKKIDPLNLPKNPKNYVLIVDEINRGNVSSIFGELITLIEKDKRAGTDEELSVILPYSKKEFKVPQNVYLIGTMNTADRSIEALDTALRRRFSFKEMPPKSYLISDESKLKETGGKIGTIDVLKVLDTINDRIEKLIDKDHKIGHSYFMEIENKSDLQRAFKNKVIPLLEEYFFGDFGKIGLILGKSFITKIGKETIAFAEFNEYDSSIRNDLMERSVFEITDQDTWDFESIYIQNPINL